MVLVGEFLLQGVVLKVGGSGLKLEELLLNRFKLLV